MHDYIGLKTNVSTYIEDDYLSVYSRYYSLHQHQDFLLSSLEFPSVCTTSYLTGQLRDDGDISYLILIIYS